MSIAWLFACISAGPSVSGWIEQLEWKAPSACPDRASVQHTIARRLRGSPGPTHRVRAVGRVTATERAFELRLTLETEQGASERRFTAASCDELADTAALLVAMTVDPTVALRDPADVPDADPGAGPAQVTATEAAAVVPDPADPPAPRVNPATPTATPPQPPKEPTQQARSRSRLAFVGSVRAGLAYGPLPRVGALVDGGLGVAGRLWLVQAVASYWPAVEGPSEQGAALTVRASLWAAGARGCVTPTVLAGRLTFPVCAGLQAGLMQARATGEGVASRVGRRPWVALTAGPGLSWWIARPLALGIRADGHVALARPQFHTVPSGRAYRARPAGVQVLAGIDVRLP